MDERNYITMDMVRRTFVIKNGKIEILSDGSPLRPLIHVKDMSRVFEWGITEENIKDNFLVLNVGSDEWNFSVKELADVLSWVSFKTKGEEHKAHTHPNSFISGVYYYSDIAEDTPIVFKRSRTPANTQELLIAKDDSNINQFSSETFTLKPKKGDLILFPSYLMHLVPKNQHSTIRTSLSMNIMPVKETGNEEFLTHFRYDDAMGN
jgi:hypothetical protein